MFPTNTVQPSERTLAEKAVWTAPELIDLNSDLGDVHGGAGSPPDGALAISSS